MPKICDLTNQRFGRLIAIRSLVERKNGGRVWECQCDCGKIKNISSSSLITGNTVSCGCHKIDNLKKRMTKYGYGEVRSAEYVTWCKMKNRCYNYKYKYYHRYGGRGIKVCDRWLNSYPNFLEDMGRKPSIKHSLDRINNDGNYEPSNCRWATTTEQARNTSKTKLVTINGVTKAVSEWADIAGIRRETFHRRLRYGHTGIKLINPRYVRK